MPELGRTDGIFLLNLGETENWFRPDLLVEVMALLEDVVRFDGPRALVTTASGRFFSNGLDAEMLGRPDEGPAYANAVRLLLARVLSLPVPTVAAVQGHAFGAGAMLALAHDYRVMQAARGFFCLPEVDLGVPPSRAAVALVQALLPRRTAHEAMTTGRRYGGDDALTAGIVDGVAAADEITHVALEIVRPLATQAGPALGRIKERMYAEVLAGLRQQRQPIPAPAEQPS